MMSVDSEILQKHEHIDLSGELPDGSIETVDNACTLAPYVDKIYWKIDETNMSAFPYNVRWYNDFDYYKKWSRKSI